MAPKTKPEAPRLVTAIHRGSPRFYPHLDATLSDGDPVPGVTEEQAAASPYLEAPKPEKETR